MWGWLRVSARGASFPSVVEPARRSCARLLSCLLLFRLSSGPPGLFPSAPLSAPPARRVLAFPLSAFRLAPGPRRLPPPSPGAFFRPRGARRRPRAARCFFPDCVAALRARPYGARGLVPISSIGFPQPGQTGGGTGAGGTAAAGRQSSRASRRAHFFRAAPPRQPKWRTR